MSFLDTIRGVMSRRVLLNYRLDPDVLQRALPAPFRPKLYRGRGIGGVCMIRFKGLRPRFLPSWLGMGSENAAHRVAVEWDEDGELREGVFIPRRDTNSWFNKTLGGRVFPGIFNRSTFEVREADGTGARRSPSRAGQPSGCRSRVCSHPWTRPPGSSRWARPGIRPPTARATTTVWT